MPDITPDPLQELLARLREARAAAAQDPFGDPVLLIALAISRRMDDGVLELDGLAAMVQQLSDSAAAERAKRIAAYVGLDGGPPDLASLAERLVRPDPEDSPIPFARYRALVETPRFAAVFTAHPTFSLPYETNQALALAASGAAWPEGLVHRPTAPTLAEEFRQAVAAIQRGRDALDGLAGALLTAAKGVWGDRWTGSGPAPGPAGLLGRLRHRWPHRYRLVGHAAAAADHEAAAARTPARAAGAARRLRRASGWRGSAPRSVRSRRRSPPCPTSPSRRRWSASPPSCSASVSRR